MLLSLVASSLVESMDMQVTQAATWEEVCGMVQSFLTDVLIFDMDAASKNYILPLLFYYPRLVLIGLDVETNRAWLIAGKETQALTMSTVKEMIFSD